MWVKHKLGQYLLTLWAISNSPVFSPRSSRVTSSLRNFPLGSILSSCLLMSAYFLLARPIASLTSLIVLLLEISLKEARCRFDFAWQTSICNKEIGSKGELNCQGWQMAWQHWRLVEIDLLNSYLQKGHGEGVSKRPLPEKMSLWLSIVRVLYSDVTT